MYDLVGAFDWTPAEARRCTLTDALYAQTGKARAVRKQAQIMAGEVMAAVTDDSSAQSELEAATSYPRPPRTVAQVYGPDIAEDLQRTQQEHEQWLRQRRKDNR